MAIKREAEILHRNKTTEKRLRAFCEANNLKPPAYLIKADQAEDQLENALTILIALRNNGKINQRLKTKTERLLGSVLHACLVLFLTGTMKEKDSMIAKAAQMGATTTVTFTKSEEQNGN